MIARDRLRRVHWRAPMWGGIAAILLLPLIAMQVTAHVQWTAFDFAAAAILLVVAGLLCEITAASIAGPKIRRLAIFAIAGAVVTIWAHGAVGIF